MHRILALWATPRSISTAFERMMIERGDHTVVDEPFSVTYYFSAERGSDRFDEVMAGSSAQQVWRRLQALAVERPVFLKDMAYHAAPYLDADMLSRLDHTFLVRDPRWTLPSLAARWPDFSRDEAGYERLYELFNRVEEATETTPVVVEADDLRRTPERIIRSWCESLGIPFLAEALSWSPGVQAQWTQWGDWYDDVAKSTGFRAPDGRAAPPIGDARVGEAIADSLPFYEALAAVALSR